VLHLGPGKDLTVSTPWFMCSQSWPRIGDGGSGG